MEDSRIVSLYWQRKEEAIDRTEEKYGRYLTTIAYNILSDLEDSKESVNDTYLAAWDSIPPQKPQVLSTYLGKLTRRISIDLFRKRSSEKRGGGEFALSLDELEECIGGNSTEEAVDVQALSQSIAKFLQTASAEARNVFIGRYYYLDPVKKIAGYCGISEAKAKVLLHRTRQELWAYLQKEGFV